MNINETYTRISTSYQVKGQKLEVEAWAEALTRRYHPAGYGTYYEISEPDESGIVTCKAWHANSCD
jgi:hypothetical protein